MSPRSIQPSLYRQDDCALGEGPFWHDGHIWWVDIERGRLLSSDAQGNLRRQMDFGQRIGAATPESAGFLIGLEREIVLLDIEAKDWRPIARPNDLHEGSRFNDGKCDPVGRWIIGSTSHGHPKTSSLYSLHHDHSLHRLRGGIAISNGLAWSADGKIMYYIDSMTHSVVAYDYDLGTGSISAERIVLSFPEKDGFPDGMSIDQEGRLWIGFWDGWAVRCYNPQTSRCEAVVSLPCARVTSCCFGGPDMNRLFITTARHELSASELLQQPLAGSLFVCDPEVKGFASTIFRNAHESHI